MTCWRCTFVSYSYKLLGWTLSWRDMVNVALTALSWCDNLLAFVRMTWSAGIISDDWSIRLGNPLGFSVDKYLQAISALLLWKLLLTLKCDQQCVWFSCRPYGIRWSRWRWESEKETEDEQKKSNYTGKIFLPLKLLVLFLVLTSFLTLASILFWGFPVFVLYLLLYNYITGNH